MRGIVVVGALVLGLVSVIPPARAAEVTGISVSPVVQKLKLAPGTPAITSKVSLANSTTTVQHLKIRVVDFASLSETGGVLFAGEGDPAHKYGLASWAALDRSELTLAPGAKAEVAVTITDSATLRPGGHYGAVLFTADPPTGGGGAGVGIQPVVSSLIFFSKTGGERYSFTVEPSLKGLYWGSLPETVSLRFHDTGNMYLVPRGTITVRGPLGHIAARGTLNDESATILPETYRRLSTELLPSAGALLPGRYRVEVLYRDESADSFQRLTAHFWVINTPALIGALLVFGTLILVYRSRRRG